MGDGPAQFDEGAVDCLHPPPLPGVSFLHDVHGLLPVGYVLTRLARGCLAGMRAPAETAVGVGAGGIRRRGCIGVHAVRQSRGYRGVPVVREQMCQVIQIYLSAVNFSGRTVRF